MVLGLRVSELILSPLSMLTHEVGGALHKAAGIVSAEMLHGEFSSFSLKSAYWILGLILTVIPIYTGAPPLLD